MSHHELKSWVPNFRDVLSGRKRAELRLDDRVPKFAVDDTVRLHEFDHQLNELTGCTVSIRLTHVARGNNVPPGWALLSFVGLRGTQDSHTIHESNLEPAK